jgi:hypothetical protein
MPRDIHPHQLHLEKGEDPVFRQTPDDLVACAWQDTKHVYFISTVHGSGTVRKRIRERGEEGGYRDIKKPRLAERYMSICLVLIY